MGSPTDEHAPVEVARCRERYEAELLIGLLEDAGIDAVFQPTVSGYGDHALWGAHRVLVRRADESRAREIVAGWWEDAGTGGTPGP